MQHKKPETTKSDSRVSHRIQITGAMVKYKEADKSIFDIFKSASDKYPILNISMKGFRFLTHDTLVKGQKLSVSVEIPLLGSEPLEARGAVAWIKYSERYKATIVGVQFTHVSKESLQRLKNLVALTGNKVKVKHSFRIRFSEKQRQQPTLWQISRDYFVKVNVINGVITGDDTTLELEIEGDKEEINKVIHNLREGGAKLTAATSKPHK